MQHRILRRRGDVGDLNTQQGHRSSSLLAATILLALALLPIGCGPSTQTTTETTPPSGGAAEDRAAPAEAPDSSSAGLRFDDPFWNTWGDGQAELSSYSLSIPRYGAIRRGTAVAIFVTETFSIEARVKADPGKHAPADEFPVMKLNLVQDFQTGIYDYNVMTSTFVALEPVNGIPAGSAAKVAFSSQEWCGHVYHQLLFGQYGVKSQLHSYFDGEADESKDLPAPRNGISGDQLMHWARGMARPMLEPGETRSVPFLPALQEARFRHQPLGWREVRLSRSDNPQIISVPAGTFEVDVLTAAEQGSPVRRYYVERAAPHRIVKWESDDGESAEMLRQIRSKYWQQNDPAGEAVLLELGLSPRPPKTM